LNDLPPRRHILLNCYIVRGEVVRNKHYIELWELYIRRVQNAVAVSMW